MSTIAAFCSHTGAQGGFGGGEAFTFATLYILNKYYDLEVFTGKEFPAFAQAFEYGIDLSKLKWRGLPSEFNWSKYDIQVNFSHSIILPPHARRNILFVLFPQHPDWDVSGYDTIVTISKFSQKWVKRYWGRDSTVIYPPVHVEDLKPLDKRKSIVSIGRFFHVPGGNNKNHLWLIRAFKRLTESLPDPDDWELHLVGSVQHRRYFEKVKAEADWRVQFHHDVERAELVKLLGEASFYWHGAGYKAGPSGQEHFGIVAVEAMAAGAIPIVHNSGGMPEIGCLTWDEPDDLVAQTLELIEDEERAEIVRGMAVECAQDFSIDAAEEPILKMMEAPILIPPHAGKAKVFPAKKTPEEITVGVISDSIRLTTGFAQPTKMVVQGLLAKHFKVACLGMYDNDPNPRHWLKDPVPIWRGCHQCNPDGLALFGEFLKVEEPDILFLCYDPGNLYRMMRALEDGGWEKPVILYFPIEAIPIMETYGQLIRATWVKGGVPITYTEWGARAIASQFKCPVEVAPHGIEHAAFQPLDAETRAKLRYAVGWHDKFVVMYVKRNKRVASFATLLDALEIIVRDGHEDVVLYLHTNPDEQNQLGSFPLREMVKHRHLDQKVFFPPDLQMQTRGVGYEREVPKERPEPKTVDEARAYNMASLNFIQRLNLADVYVDVSQADGWGLPPLEAAACGVPVVCAKDNGVKEEVWGDAAILVEPSHWDTWHIGGLLCQLAAPDVAEAIMALKNDPELRRHVAQTCYERAHKWSWGPLQQMVCRLAEELVNR